MGMLLRDGRQETYVGVGVVVYAVAREVVFGAAVGVVGGDLAGFETACCGGGHEGEELVVVAGGMLGEWAWSVRGGGLAGSGIWRSCRASGLG